MPLLDIHALTMRFGGLTAVKGFDFQVEQGKICSIIGPNGAGKTTVFNAVTGIYAPTEGGVLFEGHRLTRPFTWKVATACGVIGLCTAIALALIAANIDLLWKAAVKRTAASATAERPFTYGGAFRAAGDYLRGKLAVEPVRRGGWAIVPAEGGNPLLTAESEAQAIEQLELVEQALRLASGPQREDAIHARGEQFVVLSEPTAETPLNTFKSREAAVAWLNRLASIDRERHARRVRVGLGFVAGLLLGACGTYSVWNRSRRTPDVISRGGIARTFQNIRLFQNMTVLENVLVGMDRTFKAGVLRMMLHTPGMRRAEQAGAGRAKELLDFVGLGSKSDLLAKNLPYGDQRRLEIARALATGPRLLLLDEPAAGMNPAESHDLMGLIRKIRDQGVTVLLIEHHMKLVMDISDSIAVLDYGVKIAEGTPAEVRANPQVIAAYLGKEDAE